MIVFFEFFFVVVFFGVICVECVFVYFVVYVKCILVWELWCVEWVCVGVVVVVDVDVFVV